MKKLLIVSHTPSTNTWKKVPGTDCVTIQRAGAVGFPLSFWTWPVGDYREVGNKIF